MNVLVSINHGYLKHFKVMYRSLNASNPCKKRLFIMANDLTEQDQKEIIDEFSYSGEINFLPVSEDYFNGFPKVKRYPYTIYYRIIAPLLLPDDMDRILYLDSDLVVHNSLSDFYNVDFKGNAFYCCTQVRKFMQTFNRIRLGVNKNYVYMNTGVLLMNLNYLRKALDVEKIRKFVLKNKWKLTLFDQDVLTYFFGNKVLLAPRAVYNLADRHIRIENLKRKKGDKIDLEWVEKNNVIVHYLGRNKPWKDNYKGILKGFYKEYEN